VEPGDRSPERREETEHEARLRAILDSAVDAIIAIDESGSIQSFNRAAERLFGYAEADVLGRNVSLLMPGPYREEHDGYLAAYRRSGQGRIIGIGREVEAQRRNGEVFPIHLSVGEARLGDRRIFTGIVHDLTAQKRLEAHLLHAQKMEAVGRLAGGVAHDFNNVLQAMLGRAEAVLRRMPPRDRLRRHLVELRKAALRAASLTRQLLAVSRTQVLDPRVLDLNAVLRDAARMLRPLIGEDIELRMDLAGDLHPVKVDPDQMVQVVMNLVVNARDAMPRGGDLVIETRNVGPPDGALADGSAEAVRLSVRDTGAGMDDETRARIFEPYFTTKGDSGTGLGLSTVYGIVQQSGGSIAVDSRPGEGTVFRILLPRAEGQPEALARPASVRRLRRRRRGRVLLVEDDAPARGALELLLREDGHTVLSAGSAAEAERLYRGADPIDVIVTDTVLPRVSGPELVARLRAAQPGVRVIFMSGYAPETAFSHGELGPGVAFFQKPFEIRELLAKVRELLAG
jgi:PAS domain S-box-containing protein